MTPAELHSLLLRIIEAELRLSVMIWGAPGIGKSSIVAQVAQAKRLEVTDLRLSQLAPTDLRGLPVPGDGQAHWYPPDFLPQGGRGILFLDELNLAAPAVQGIAQQLILDRRVGSYALPEGWFVWAAGNRKDDRAAVFDMPSPLANRFIHLHVAADLDAFRSYALQRDFDEQLLAFISFRTELLHKMTTSSRAWPSPRTWEMASQLKKHGIGIAPAVGEAVAAEFRAFVEIYHELPDIEAIANGAGDDLDFPSEPSRRYAVTIGLAARATTAERTVDSMKWLRERAALEWAHLALGMAMTKLRAAGTFGAFAARLSQEPELAAFVNEFARVAAL